MIKFIIDAVGVIFELLIIYYFLSYMTKDKPSKKVVLFIYPISFLVMSLSTLLPYSEYIFPILNFFIVFHLAFYHKGKFVVKFLFSLLLVIIFMIAEGVMGSLLVLVAGVEVNAVKESMMLYSTGVLGSKLFVFLSVKILGYNKSRLYKNISKTTFVTLLLTPISSLMAMYTISISLEHYKNTISAVVVLCSSVLLVISNVFMFSIFEKQIKNEQTKARLDYTEKQLEQQIENYKLLSNQQEEMRKLSHDMKHYVHAMKKNNNNEDLQHIENIERKLSEYESFYDTGHPALDALLHAKNNEMKNLGICFTTSIILPAEININSYDLCVVLGNALDNAIEACEKIEEIEKRSVNLRIDSHEKYISIYVENPSNEKFVPTSERKTTKKNPLGHGYGLDSIRTIAQKYDGDVGVECENGCFILSLLLKN